MLILFSSLGCYPVVVIQHLARWQYLINIADEQLFCTFDRRYLHIFFHLGTSVPESFLLYVYNLIGFKINLKHYGVVCPHVASVHTCYNGLQGLDVLNKTRVRFRNPEVLMCGLC